MKKVLLLVMVSFTLTAKAGTYETPECYSHVPTTCSYDEMTLAMCNYEGKPEKVLFLLSQRMYVTGGNRFSTASGNRVCTVKGIKGTEPKRYRVVIEY